MDELPVVDTAGAARLTGLSASHLEKLRFYKKEGPPFLRIGRAIRYRRADLLAWLDKHHVEGGVVR